MGSAQGAANTGEAMEKHIVDGRVGVLYSPGFGAGWSTWGDDALAMDADLVKAFIEGGAAALVAATEAKYLDTYTGGAQDVQLEWVPVGTQFRINEYDGNESIEYLGPQSFMTA